MIQFPRSAVRSPRIGIAPLVDVVFLLLIFFMLTATFGEPSIPLELPRAGGQQGVEHRQLVVTIDRKGQTWVGLDKVAREELASALRARLGSSPGSVVIFRADRRVQYERFVEVLDAARSAGAASVQIAHQPRKR